MKLNKRFLPWTLLCCLLPALVSCLDDSRREEEEIGCEVRFDHTGAEEGKYTELSSLSYTVCLFRAQLSSDKKLTAANYVCQKVTADLSDVEVNHYSFKIPNTERGYAYRLFVLASFKGNEGVETKLAPLSEGVSLFEDIEISLVEGRDGEYVPLSKDNYYACEQLSETQIIEQGVTHFELKLRRLVGQLVFDFFKSDGAQPLPIDDEFGSTLDRVKCMEVQVSGMTTSFKPYAQTVVKSAAPVASQLINTKLDSDYKLWTREQNPLQIEPLVKENVDVRGGARVFSLCLLPTGVDGNELLKSSLSFTYYDTSIISSTEERLKQVVLNLPSAGRVLKIAENCYTVTNIRLKNNRVIDLNASGSVEIDTDWDSE